MPLDLARTLAQALDVKSETRIRSIDRALTAYARLTPLAPTVPFSGTIAAAQVISGTFDNARVAEASVTQHEAAIDHDALAGFLAAEHIDWAATGAEDVHVDRIAEAAVTQHEAAIDHDALAGFVGDEHIDWSATGAEDVHADRIGAVNTITLAALGEFFFGADASLIGTTLDLADDATGSVNLPHGTSLIIIVADLVNTTTAFWRSGTTWRLALSVGPWFVVGIGANPDTDGIANVWLSGATQISIKNRLGSQQKFAVLSFGVT